MAGDPADLARRFRGARTAAAVHEAAVESARGLLGADEAALLVAADDRLVTRASTRTTAGEAPTYPRWTGLLGAAYGAGRACVIDDAGDTRSAAAAPGAAEASGGPAPDGPADRPHYRSLCCAPVAGHGLLVARASAPGGFDDGDRDRLAGLADLTGAALDRVAEAPPAALPNGGTGQDGDPDELLEEVADILSHDLKSPLTVALGSLALALDTGDEAHVERAEAAVERIESMVDEVVLLARTGTLVEQTERIEFGPVARQAWANLETGDAGFVVDQSATIDANRDALSHLLENLFENAVAHAGPDVTVRVGTTQDGFYVADDGPGIPPEHRDRVFERGYKVGDGGSGLGLSIVERIAEAHGWRVTVEDALEGGARFLVTDVTFP